MTGALARLALARPRRRLERLRRDPAGAQAEVLGWLLAAHATTPLGRALGLEGVRGPADFAARVPLRGFEAHRPHLPRPRYWAQTTGTTAGQKDVPVTRALLRANAAAVQLLLASRCLELGALRPVLGKVFFLGACTPLTRGPDGVLRGAATTIGLRERPWFFRRRVLPGPEVDALPSWAERMDAVVDQAAGAAGGPAPDVRVAFGMPPWLLAFAERLAARRGVLPRALWPGLELVVTGGTFAAPYRRRLEAAFGAPGEGGPAYRAMYSATEGFFGVQDGPDPAYLPLWDSIYLELVPPDELDAERPTRLRPWEAELDRDYALVISSWAGLFAYPVGDTVRVVSRDPLRLVPTGRVRRWANVAGEKVTIAQVEEAAVRAGASLGLALGEVALLAEPPADADVLGAARPRHRWLVEVAPTRDAAALAPALAQALDRALAALSPTYRTRREGLTPALGAPEVTLLPPGRFQAWLEAEGRTGAHHKVPRILESLPPALSPAPALALSA